MIKSIKNGYTVLSEIFNEIIKSNSNKDFIFLYELKTNNCLELTFPTNGENAISLKIILDRQAITIYSNIKVWDNQFLWALDFHLPINFFLEILNKIVLKNAKCFLHCSLSTETIKNKYLVLLRII